MLVGKNEEEPCVILGEKTCSVTLDVDSAGDIDCT